MVSLPEILQKPQSHSFVTYVKHSTLDKVQHLHWSIKITTHRMNLVVHLVVIYKLLFIKIDLSVYGCNCIYTECGVITPQNNLGHYILLTIV